MRTRKTDPELPILLPFEPGIASNGEFVPQPPTLAHRRIRALALQRAEEIARSRRIDRRRFLMGMGGLAVTLGAVNLIACESNDGKPPGGTYVTPTDGEPNAVCELLEGDEFIFDIQTHHVNPATPPGRGVASLFQSLNPDCDQSDRTQCFSRYYYLKDIYLESDTTVAVLSDTPSPSDDQDPLTFEEMRQTLDLVDELSAGGASRSLLHSIVVPNVGRIEDQLDRMQARAENLDVAAWKVYTPYGGDSGGWFLDDEQYGIPIIEKARETGVKIICAHKGLPLFGFDQQYASPRDIGVVAKAYPDMQFVAYHSGWDPMSTTAEGPYDPEDAELGVNALVKTMLDNDLPPNSNVWAELGSTWRGVMSDPTQAAHVLGKLLKYVGEDRVLWGTDCIWYGSPQPQIVAFRAFQMNEDLSAQYDYPELTPALKAKIFGLNAASLYGIDAEAQRCAIGRDAIEQYRDIYRELEPDTHEPRWAAHMPIDRRGALRYFASIGGSWSPWR